ncbi:hypothetical protein N7491_002759 [Penicillium cf. griseofulvum]|uniref:Uncharacterized protein n=1 Tax=Penicillium cf. griseofulvum TaxID=2972120 RepID=A0A9W9MSC1_9EURO|nr:hypothetical protein N7472_003074 [Penicillium cf. griseofulvum]KAJ5440353.1 hypothetical protein N7491_002759 [Penicillium cf. griseofulvum]KAJ5448401.1 hypothetical protein N7445_003222 [Penicillium cf. griseofulvum]
MAYTTNHEPESVLSRAAFHGDLAQVSMLLDNGEYYRSWDKSGWTALHWAVVAGHLQIIRRLLEHHSESRQPDPELYKIPKEQVKSYTDGPSPIILAAEGQNCRTSSDVEIFCELANHLEIAGKASGVAKFNTLWEQGRFDIVRSSYPCNLWRVLGKDQQHNGLECQIPKPGGLGRNDLNSHKTNELNWKSVLLLCAIRDSQWSVMQMLIKAGADVNFDYALHVATFRSDPRYVQCLMKHGADVNCITRAGRTAIHEAVMNGFLDTITALVNGGADVNQQQTMEYYEPDHQSRLTTEGFQFGMTRKGASTLMQACGFLLGRNDKARQRHAERESQLPEEKSLEIVRFLLSKGADPTLTDSLGMTVLHYAVLQPHVSLIKLLVQSGASVEALDHAGRMPLHFLARCDDNISVKDLEQVVFLLCQKNTAELSLSLLNRPVSRPPPSSEDHGTAVRSLTITKSIRKNSRVSWSEEEDDSRTPLAIALLSNRWKVVDVLMRFGATFPPSIDLQAVLDNAIKDHEVNIVDTLLQNGVQPPPFSLMSLIRSYTEQRKKNNAASDLYTRFEFILTSILYAGADVNFCETEEIPKTEDKLSESDEDDTESDDENTCVKDSLRITTPLNLAARIGGSRNILEELLLFGADVSAASSETFDPILTAALFGELGDLECLLGRALTDPRESHWSIFLGDIPEEADAIVRVCHSLKKADALNRTNYKGRTLLHLAVEQQKDRLVSTLISHGARPDILDNERRPAIELAAIARNAHAFEALFIAKKGVESYNSPEGEKFGQLQNNVDLALLYSTQGPGVISTILRIAPDYIFKRYLGDNNYPMIYQAAQSGNMEVLSFLLSQKVDIEASDYYGWRPLHIACYRGHTNIVQYLIGQGANVHCATQAWNDGDVKPSGLYRTDPWTGTPLHLAAMGGHVDIVEILLDLGVDIHASTKVDTKNIAFASPGHGPTALHLVLDTGVYYYRQGEVLSEDRLKIAQLLVNAGAMVRGMVCQMPVEERLRFHNFPNLWEALVAEDASDEGDVPANP